MKPRPFMRRDAFYFFSQQGVATVLKPGRTCNVLATNTLDNGFMASPAVGGKSFFLRAKSHLYRVEDLGGVNK